MFHFHCNCVTVFVCVCEDEEDVFCEIYAYETLYLRACVRACMLVRDDDAHVYT